MSLTNICYGPTCGRDSFHVEFIPLTIPIILIVLESNSYRGYRRRRGLLKCEQAQKEMYFHFRKTFEKTGRKLISVQNVFSSLCLSSMGQITMRDPPCSPISPLSKASVQGWVRQPGIHPRGRGRRRQQVLL